MLRLLTFVSFSLIATSGFAQQFTDVTAEIGLDGLSGGTVSFVDFNNDNHIDINAGPQLWINQGDGTFQILPETGLPGNCVWADINNDGFKDAFCYSGPGYLFLNQAGKSLKNISDNLPDTPTKVSLGATMGDFNGDGLVDIYVGGYETPGYLPDAMYFNNGDTTFKEVWRTAGTTMPARGITTADYDEDGDLDIYVSNYRLVPNTLWQNDGKGEFAQVEGEKKVDGDGGLGAWGHTIGSSFGDFNNDGHLDLFVGNFSHPPSYQDRPKFLKNLGPDSSFTFQDLSSEAGLGWQESFASPTLGDFDNDGLLDLYFTTVYPGDHCVLYKNLGNFKFQNVTATSGVSADLTYQAGWADFDGDGDLDLATRGRIYRNNNAASNYLRLAITAKSPLDSNAIGAVARIKLGEKTLTRQVAVSTGQGNANSPILHFGLGDISGDVSVEFTWLGGGKRVFKLAANQLHQISIP